MLDSRLLVDDMMSTIYDVKGKGFLVQLDEHYDVWGDLKDFIIGECNEPQEIAKMDRFRFDPKHPLGAREWVDAVLLGMRLKGLGYDHVVASIKQKRDEINERTNNVEPSIYDTYE